MIKVAFSLTIFLHTIPTIVLFLRYHTGHDIDVICSLWSPAGKGLTSLLSLVVYNCESITFPLISWVRCGT